MARKQRVEYPGAIHHVINRGNYRRDLFESAGAAEAFLGAMKEGGGKFGWRIHGYVLMRNHYHLAVETPEPTLGEGMHWLQSTLATRFNRLRKENGHLFQGRYKALVVEDFAALGRLVDYIHLNPVRARIVPAEQVTAYGWSSLRAFLKQPREPGLHAEDWLNARGGWADDKEGWVAYAEHLTGLAQDEAAWEREGVVGLSRGWAIGTQAWRKAMAEEYARLSAAPGLRREEMAELRQANWAACLDRCLACEGKVLSDLETRPRKAAWKIKLAGQIRNETGASIAWLATHLKLGGAATARGYLHQARHHEN